MADLEELIERVESGTGADRVLDREVWCQFGWSWERRGRDRREWLYNSKGTRRDPTSLIDWTFGQMDLTTSLDAVLALIEAKLPGASCVLNVFDVQRTPARVSIAKAHLSSYDARPVSIGRPGALGSASSPARALLAATLRALKETQHDR